MHSLVYQSMANRLPSSEIQKNTTITTSQWSPEALNTICPKLQKLKLLQLCLKYKLSRKFKKHTQADQLAKSSAKQSRVLNYCSVYQTKLVELSSEELPMVIIKFDGTRQCLVFTRETLFKEPSNPNTSKLQNYTTNKLGAYVKIITGHWLNKHMQI